MEKLLFKLDVFEGPLDLLMHLISKNKVNIYDIPVVQITEQYLELLDQMRNMDLDVSSEFVVMAAHLLWIKSKMLLPKTPLENDDDDPRNELVERLLEYRRYKNSLEFLHEHEFSSRYMFFKKAENIKPKEIICEQTYSVNDLLLAFNDILERTIRRNPPPKKTFEGIVRRETVSVKDKVRYIKIMVNGGKEVAFVELFQDMTTKSELVATFLALLELIKVNRISANYNKGLHDFIIKELKSGDNTDGW